jgi:RNA polymerase sigma-70 factor (ECF subfamily)
MELAINMELVSNYHVTEDVQKAELGIIEAAKESPQHFAPLYEKYYEQIFRFIYQRLDDKELAYDTASQVFLKAMTNLNKYEHRGVPFSSWLYQIARNEVYSLFKNNKAERTVNIDSSSVYNIIDEMETDQLDQYHEKMTRIISELPEDELQLIEMRFFEKRSFKEIAEILEITENNTKVRLYRLLDKLKKQIKPN